MEFDQIFTVMVSDFDKMYDWIYSHYFFIMNHSEHFLNQYRWAVRVSPAVANRIVDAARGVLNKFLPDIYIYTDHLKGSQSGK